MTMPSINLGPRVRFALYLIGSLASLGVVYAVDKAWAGDAEVRLVQGLVALLGILAAANTNTGKPVEQAREVGEAIGEEINKAAASAQRPILGKAFTGGTFSKADEDARDPHRP